MSAISVTAANVLASSQATTAVGIAGATVTAGQALYSDPSDSGKLKLADADASDTAARVVGIALHGASSGQPLKYVIEDPDFTPGATLSLSAAADDGIYILGATAGSITPVGDIAASWRPVVLYVAKSTTKCFLKIHGGHNGVAALTS